MDDNISLKEYIDLRFETIDKATERAVLNGKNPKSVPSYLGWIKWCNAYNLSNKYLGVNHVSV